MASSSSKSVHPLLAKVCNIPELKPLAEALLEKLTLKDCYLKQDYKEYQALCEEHDFVYGRYLKAKIVEETIEDYINDFNLRKLTSQQALEETLAVDELSDAWDTAQLVDYIKFTDVSSDAINLLGLEEEDFEVQPLSKRTMDVVKEKLEEKLFENCLSILRIVDSKKFDELQGVREQYLRIQLLPEMIKTEVDTINEAETAVFYDEEERNLALGNPKLLKLLIKNYEMLEKLVEKFKMGILDDAYTTEANYLTIKAEALELKTKFAELEILCSIYKPESVKALKRIRQHLDKRLNEIKTKIEQTKLNLLQYEAVGSEMEDVAVEYGKIKKEIEGQKWILNELNKK